MLRLPNGQKTDNEKLYERKWRKVADIVAKSLGMKTSNVWGEITFDREVMRSNGKAATVSQTTMPHNVVLSLAISLANANWNIKQLKGRMERRESQWKDAWKKREEAFKQSKQKA